MIALDLCQVHYQALLIICQKFTEKYVEGVEKEEKLNQCVTVLDLIINYIINATYVKKVVVILGWIN